MLTFIRASRSRSKSVLFALFLGLSVISIYAVNAAFTSIDSIRLSPLQITVTPESSLPSEVQDLERASLPLGFDRDTHTEYVAYGESQLTLNFDSASEIHTLKVFGAAPYDITVKARVNGQWQDVEGLIDLDLSSLTPFWHNYEVTNSVTTDQLQISFTSSTGGKASGLKELEIWGQAERVTVNTGANLLAGIETDHAAPQARFYAASQAEGIIGDVENLDDDTSDNSFNVTLDRDPRSIKRAWLSYESHAAGHWVSVVRDVNGLGDLGGHYRFASSAWSGQLEQINPHWLEQGSNTITFKVIKDNSYRIRNLGLLIELDDGSNYVESVMAYPVTNSNTALAAHDGDNLTGWAPYDGSAPKKAQRYLQLDFDKQVQLDGIAINLNNSLKGKIETEFLENGEWLNAGIGAILGKDLVEGWNTIAVDRKVFIQGIRLIFEQGNGSKAEIMEVAPVGSGVGATQSPERIDVSYPDAGQYYGDKAYIRGFVQPIDNGSGNAQVFVAGQEVTREDAAFEALVNKIDFTSEDNGYSVTVDVHYPDNTRVSKKVYLTDGLDAATANAQMQTYGVEAEVEAEAAISGANTLASVASSDNGSNVTASPTFASTSGDCYHLEHDESALKLCKAALEENESPSNIKISSLKHDDLPPLNPGMTNVTRGPRKGYRFYPHGKKFRANIEVDIPYDVSQIPEGMTEEDIKTWYFDEELGRWIQLDRVEVNKKDKKIKSHTDHFTDMINATLSVPENPQAVNFNPTQIKDIKAADPGAEINLIEPPQANNMGDARLSYPIQLPPGRAGLQPELSIQYNSSGGNGWLGAGWDLTVPSISIDTRWGVPRYSSTQETETYMFNGQQLSPVAHRGQLQARESDKVFHTRVEGGFKKIIRHGDGPSKYWWEVIDKDGTRHFYGGGPDTNAPTVNSTLQDKNNNVFKWALRKTIDTNGNTVTYKCNRECDTGVKNGNQNYNCDGSGVAGYQLYVKTIHYTGHGTDLGAYSVSFTRDKELNGTRRPDVTIDGRGGFKQVTAERLRKIEVKYNSEDVRSYELIYETGPFEKSLLKTVAQYDSKGKWFNEHKFDYFNEIKQGDTYNAFNAPVDWTTGDDNSGLPLISDVADYSALGATQGLAGGGSFSLGFAPFPTKYLSFNAMAGSNASTSEGRLSLIDIDGDGLPDKVWGDGSFQYRKNTVTPDTDFNTKVKFGSASGSLAGLNSLSDEQTQSFNFGGQVYVFGVNIVKDFSYSMTTTNKYLSDVNGDGLVDLVDSGTVKFNKKVDASGEPVFYALSENSLYPIGAGAVKTEGLIPEDAFEDAEKKALEQNPLSDAIRRWRAPFSGTVEISGDVQLVNVLEDDRYTEKEKEQRRSYKTADGVRVAIEKDGEEEPEWSQDIEQDDFSVYDPGGFFSNSIDVDVVKGDIIYFRVHSRFDGAYDEVKWSPVVSYTELDDNNHSDNAASLLVDANGFNPYEYHADNEFTYGGRITPIEMPFNGEISITGSFKKSAVTSDNIKLTIHQITDDEFETLFEDRRDYHLLHQLKAPIYETELKWDEISTLDIKDISEHTVNRSDRLFVTIHVDSNIDLNAIQWNEDDPFSIFYTKAYAISEAPATLDEDGNPADPLGDGWTPNEPLPVKDANGEYLIKPYPIYDIHFYTENSLTTKAQEDWLSEEMGWLLVEPRVTPIEKEVNGQLEEVIDHDSELVFTVKSQGKLQNKSVMTFKENDKYYPQKYSFAIPVPKGEKYFYDFSTRDPDLKATLDSTDVSVHYIRPQYTENLTDIPINKGASTRQWNSPSATVTVLPQIAYTIIDPSTATDPNDPAQVGTSGDLVLKVSRDVKDDTTGDITTELVVERPIYIDTTKPFNPYDFAFDIVNTDPTKVYFSFSSDNDDLVDQIQSATLLLAIGTGYALAPPNETEFDDLNLFLTDQVSEEDDGKAVQAVTSAGKLAIAPDLSRQSSRLFDFDSQLDTVISRRHTPLDVNGVPEEDADGNPIVITNEVYRYSLSLVEGEEYNPGKHTFDVSVAFNSVTETNVELIIHYETADATLIDRGLKYDLWTHFRVHNSGYQVPSWEPPHELHSKGNFEFFASPYRGWSYGGYNANKEIVNEDTGEEIDYGALMIDATRFNLSNSTGDYSVPTDYQDQLDLANETEMKAQTAFPSAPQSEESRWIAGDSNWWIKAAYISSSRMGLDYIRFMREEDLNAELPETGPDGGAGASGVPRLSIVDGQDTTGVGFYVSISNSNTPVKGLLDYMDLNGDRFPDVVGSGGIQYTDMTGGLGNTTGGFGGNTRESTSNAYNVAPGGTVPNTSANGKGETNGSPAKSDKPSQNANYGFTGSLGYRDDTTDSAFRDVNGDGLPDRVSQNSSGVISVQLNIGYGFEAPEVWGTAPLSDSHSIFVNAGLSYNDGVKGYAGSITVTGTQADVDETITDVNGDGLPDRIRKRGSGLTVNLNTGTGFTSDLSFASISGQGFRPGFNQSFSLNGGASFNITLGPLCLVICYTDINPGFNFSTNMGRTEIMVQDINGDGYADYLTSTDDNEIKVSLNLRRRTNLLKSVYRPLGGTIDISYKRTGNTFNLPQSLWVMDKVTVFDGVDDAINGEGADFQVTKFGYSGGYHNRYERDFYGFKTVEETHLDTSNLSWSTLDKAKHYRRILRTYINDNFYLKGLLDEEQTDEIASNGDFIPYHKTNHRYELRTVENFDAFNNLRPVFLH